MAIDFAKCLGCVVLVLTGLWFAKRLMFDCDAPVYEPEPQPVPDAAHEPHWIDPCLNFYGVEVKGRDQ